MRTLGWFIPIVILSAFISTLFIHTTFNNINSTQAITISNGKYRIEGDNILFNSCDISKTKYEPTIAECKEVKINIGKYSSIIGYNSIEMVIKSPVGLEPEEALEKGEYTINEIKYFK